MGQLLLQTFVRILIACGRRGPCPTPGVRLTYVNFVSKNRMFYCSNRLGVLLLPQITLKNFEIRPFLAILEPI